MGLVYHLVNDSCVNEILVQNFLILLNHQLNKHVQINDPIVFSVPSQSLYCFLH
ncbi:unnamed protein product [Schistosoma margrebowiei]|uniref:Uncharacterized protein n=1 Tax=Schistosoma margrebowiei TaxID=48269 RepID=A0A3P8CKR4_9TREM|nr:unnamed protein product [Schistosoma margrebowiei]